MKCARCATEMHTRWWCLAVGAIGEIYVVNLCAVCVDSTIGRPPRMKMEAFALKSGWIQPQLPGVLWPPVRPAER